jgi:hypothetical protein
LAPKRRSPSWPQSSRKYWDIDDDLLSKYWQLSKRDRLRLFFNPWLIKMNQEGE